MLPTLLLAGLADWSWSLSRAVAICVTTACAALACCTGWRVWTSRIEVRDDVITYRGFWGTPWSHPVQEIVSVSPINAAPFFSGFGSPYLPRITLTNNRSAHAPLVASLTQRRCQQTCDELRAFPAGTPRHAMWPVAQPARGIPRATYGEPMTSQDVPVTVRPAVPTDAQAVWPLVTKFATSFQPRPAPFHRAWGELITSPDACVLVAVDPSGGVVGYLLGFVHATFFANAPVAWVEEVMVDASARRRGVGGALMRAAEVWASDRGVAYVALATRRAASFYTALGYDESATFFKKNL